jgi:aspartate aminotransferase
MKLSQRISQVNESITLKLNEKAQAFIDQGRKVYNLTAGQLPFKPMPEFIEEVHTELNLLKSFQYSPASGFSELRKKFLKHFENTHSLNLDQYSKKYSMKFDLVVSNGVKHSLFNVLAALVNPSDEVIIFSPYWLSYPELIKSWDGVPVVVKGEKFNSYIPLISELKEKITSKTKCILLNAPNNPLGIYYPKNWMEEFAQLMLNYPDIIILSDEIYFELVYFGTKPTFFYQLYPELLKQTIVMDGISKSFASPGLRIGYALGDKTLMDAIGRFQAQTTSGPSSLIQRALIDFDFEKMKDFIEPVNQLLRANSSTLQKKLVENSLNNCWYQTNSAFYYLLDFTRTPVFKKYSLKESQNSHDISDYATQICNDLLDQANVAVVPASDFGVQNSCRLSLVLEPSVFENAIDELVKFLIQK